MANNRGYKRSWKNYLLDSNYQLRFTFTMMAVAGVLMAGLGYWVSRKASTATEVARNKIDEIGCPDVLKANEDAVSPSEVKSLIDDSFELDEMDDSDGVETDDAPSETKPEPEAGSDEGEAAGSDAEEEPDDEEERPSRKIQVVVGDMQAVGPSAEEVARSKQAHDACKADVAARKKSVEDRERLITTVLILSGVVLLLGLGVYGIKATHKVAGPLFKVGLYLKKLESDTYDTVYNLRKGDQLMDFYEHFKAAHAGLTTMNREDLDQLKNAIALAKEAGIADNGEVKEQVAELERLLSQREASIVDDKAQ